MKSLILYNKGDTTKVLHTECEILEQQKTRSDIK
nr:MAG TPA: hypothetical protein [Caudoviricetes sp.]